MWGTLHASSARKTCEHVGFRLVGVSGELTEYYLGWNIGFALHKRTDKWINKHEIFTPDHRPVGSQLGFTQGCIVDMNFSWFVFTYLPSCYLFTILDFSHMFCNSINTEWIWSKHAVSVVLVHCWKRSIVEWRDTKLQKKFCFCIK